LLSGILVQLPLPKHINEEKILSEISIEKDVDGFHPLNIGKLAMKGREPLFVPCTPKVSEQPAQRLYNRTLHTRVAVFTCDS
jgi:5,10-methylene-tetrahydrofolate dehydrogenase/methenyl tetrahydrofolate cyclohydrolase